MSHLPPGDALMERYLLEYIRSYSRYYSRSESKTLQRCREQMYQERDMAPLVRRLERVRGPLAGLKVLEIGSGSGSRAVAAAMRGAEVWGIEPSEAGVEASRLRASRYPDLRVHFQAGVGEELPYPDEAFDLVFSAEVLQHVQDLEATIAETARVLRPGGRCYHEGPNALYPYEFHYRVFWLPLMPKPLGKLYARARGKDPRHLDDINFLYRRPLVATMRRHGFAGFGDLYAEEAAAKAADASAVRSAPKRRLFRLLKSLGLADLALRLVGALDLYPQLRIHATKQQC